MKPNLSDLIKYLANTRGKTRKEIILAVKAWQIKFQGELVQLKQNISKEQFEKSQYGQGVKDQTICLIDEILGVAEE